MKHTVIIDNICDADRLGEMLSGNFTFSPVESADKFCSVISEKFPDFVMINADSAAGNLTGIINFVRAASFVKAIPVIITTASRDTERQSEICGCGADEVIVLPLCTELLIKRIDTVLALFNESSRDSCLNFEELINALSEKNIGRGAFFVRQSEFTNIYRFIVREMERSGKNVQAILFTLNYNSDSENAKCSQGVMDVLSNAVQFCLRRGDILSVCSENQIVILLLGADDNGGHLVANRILSNFYSECDDQAYELHYDIRQINAE